MHGLKEKCHGKKLFLDIQTNLLYSLLWIINLIFPVKFQKEGALRDFLGNWVIKVLCCLKK